MSNFQLPNNYKCNKIIINSNNDGDYKNKQKAFSQ